MSVLNLDSENIKNVNIIWMLYLKDRKVLLNLLLKDSDGNLNYMMMVLLMMINSPNYSVKHSK